ncbi:MAG: hypothetical protein U9Q38_09300, partial [Thermodesulfobacteriota bacterium]|nr:hypothetical protein [Thermodesulfobacteriota bacterium]
MPQQNSQKIFGIIVSCAIIIAAAATGLWLWTKEGKDSVSKIMPPKVQLPVKSQPVIDYNNTKDFLTVLLRHKLSLLLFFTNNITFPRDHRFVPF